MPDQKKFVNRVWEVRWISGPTFKVIWVNDAVQVSVWPVQITLYRFQKSY